MKKFIILCFALLLCFAKTPTIYKTNAASASTLPEYLTNCNQIKIINNNSTTLLNTDSQDFYNLKTTFLNLLDNSLELPALGVSIHNHLMQDIKNGLWAEFGFNFSHTHSGMQFDSWLIKIEKDNTAITINRGNSGNYYGRTYFLDLEQSKSLDIFYNYLIKFLKQKNAA